MEIGMNNQCHWKCMGLGGSMPPTCMGGRVGQCPNINISTNLWFVLSLMATNAARYRMVAGKNVSLLEFGLRRAQGPDGGLSASKYSYVGESHLINLVWF